MFKDLYLYDYEFTVTKTNYSNREIKEVTSGNMITSILDSSEISVTEYDKDSRIIRTTTTRNSSEIDISVNSRHEDTYEVSTCQYIYTYYPNLTFFYDYISKRAQQTYEDFEHYVEKPKDSYLEFYIKIKEYGPKVNYIDKNTYTIVYDNEEVKTTYQCNVGKKSWIYIKIVETEYSIQKYEYKLKLKNVKLEKNFD